jgi:hypothetical protein
MFDFDYDDTSDTLPGDYAEMFQQIYHELNRMEVSEFEVDSEEPILEWHYKS